MRVCESQHVTQSGSGTALQQIYLLHPPVNERGAGRRGGARRDRLEHLNKKQILPNHVMCLPSFETKTNKPARNVGARAVLGTNARH